MSSFRNFKALIITMSDGLAWPVTRSLWLSGITVHVMGQLPGSMLARSVECSKYHLFQDIRWENGVLDISMMTEVLDVVRKCGIDVVLAADLSTNFLLSRWYLEEKNRDITVITPTPETILLLHDKWKLTSILDKLGLPYPESELTYTSEDILNTKIEFPIITKPLDQASSKGVQLHWTKSDLIRRIEKKTLFDGFPLLVQKYIPGDDIGYSFLAKDGKMVASALCRQKKRGIRQYFNDNRMNNYVSSLLSESEYNGVGHIDARYDPDKDDYRILEVNPRFWASVLYVTSAGVNIPEYLVRLSRGESLEPIIPHNRSIRLNLYERTVTLAVRTAEIYYFSIGLAK